MRAEQHERDGGCDARVRCSSAAGVCDRSKVLCCELRLRVIRSPTQQLHRAHNRERSHKATGSPKRPRTGSLTGKQKRTASLHVWSVEKRGKTRRSHCEGHVTLLRWMLQFQDKFGFPKQPAIRGGGCTTSTVHRRRALSPREIWRRMQTFPLLRDCRTVKPSLSPALSL